MTRPCDAGLPFVGNSQEEAARIVCETYVQRRNQFFATVANTQIAPPIILTAEGTLTAEGIRVSPPRIGQPSLHVHGPSPPVIAEFLLRLCTMSARDESAVGCINECFARDCANRGQARARWLYWADALGYLMRQLPRILKLAALFGVIKRLFG
jgi:hypothetical protein